jgi:hypothetical protein
VTVAAEEEAHGSALAADLGCLLIAADSPLDARDINAGSHEP